MLGDPDAIKAACPERDASVLAGYTQDSICGTWEKLADAIYTKGSKGLKKLGYPRAGQIKCEWAEKIAPYMNVENNRSKSFQVFRDTVRELVDSKTA